MNSKKLWATVILVGAVYFLVTAIMRFSDNLEEYRLIFGFTTENRVLYLIVRLFVVYVFVMFGIKKFRESKRTS